MDNLFSKVSTDHLSMYNEEKKQISNLYAQWSKELENKAKSISEKTSAPSSVIKKAQLNSLSKALKNQQEELNKQIEKNISGYVKQTSDNVIQAAKEYAEKFGLSPGAGAYSSINKNVVDTIVSGQIYGYKNKSKSYLSKSIWGDGKDTQQKLQRIVAGGIAQDKSIYEIAKNLEDYVTLKSYKLWNLKDASGAKIFPKNVEYSSQRLARTMSQHAYQKTIAETCKTNPFVKKIRWIANGSRVCPLCEERNGKEYTPGNLPLDHPNGMCVMEPVIKESDEQIQQRIVDWYYSEPGTDPDIDKWAKELDATINVDKMAEQVKKSISEGKVPGNQKKQAAPEKKAVEKKETKAEELEETQKEETKKEVLESAKQALKQQVSDFDKAKWLERYENQKEKAILEDFWNKSDKLKFDKQDTKMVQTYSGSTYMPINDYLRGLGRDRKIGGTQRTASQFANDLNLALSKCSTPYEVVAKRGSSYNMLEQLGIDFSESNKSNVIGSVVNDKGFTSTSPVGGNFYREYYYYIKVPEGSQASYIAPISKHEDEKELLINNDAKFRIEEIEYEDGKPRNIYMTLINLQNK